ncbi:DUF2987 domain-containing protein [Moritella marina ATCC 15381]|uniref:DUF2987 domain-containing protein n=1 Tax=Moritella marina ATCC 15381 TaxID=1202962 RepID=A0A5J6WHM3_MORMI|nr:DUF2987 domain-containing protein [Moritella marina]QFI37537.1 DUF2987 domain-containing protein [Moritella marina ATCC 15381]
MFNNHFIKVVLLSSLLVPSLSAQELVVGYDGFYNRIKSSKKEQYDNTKMGVFLNNSQTGKHCQIENAFINFEGAITDVEIGKDSELLLPFNKQLRDDKAKLHVNVTDIASCDLALQIMASENNSTEYSSLALVKQIEEFDLFLGNMAGYFGRMNLPTTIGVQFIFDESVEAYTMSGDLFKSGEQISLSQDEIIRDKIAGIKFSKQPLRIIPLTEI